MIKSNLGRSRLSYEFNHCRKKTYIYCIDNEINDLGMDMVSTFIDLIDILYPDEDYKKIRFPQLCTRIMDSLCNTKNGKSLFRRTHGFPLTTYANGHASNHLYRNVSVIRGVYISTHKPIIT